jgi:CHASE2 domain
MMELLEKLEFFIPVIIVCLWMGKPLIQSVFLRRFVIAVHAFVLCVLTLFTFNKPSWRWGEMATITREARHEKPDIEAYHFIWDNFILVDNTLDKQLVQVTGTEPSDSLQNTITDRKKLATFITLLAQQVDKVDRVIIDIGFDALTSQDSRLSAALRVIAQKGKLLLSADAGPIANGALRFNDSLYANVREQTSDRLFVSHYLLGEHGISLPYNVYLRMHHTQLKALDPDAELLVERTASGGTVVVPNPMLPRFRILDERLLLAGNAEGTPTLHRFYLGEIQTGDGAELFIDNLARRKALGQHNIILIGAFSSPVEDVHQTLYKDMHGPVILLNVVDALEHHQHYLSWFLVFGLFIAYAVITTFLIYRGLKLNVCTGHQRDEDHHPFRIRSTGFVLLDKFIQRIVDIVLGFMELLFVEEPHFTLLFILVTAVEMTTGKLINALSLLLYLGTVYVCLKYTREKFSS